MPGRERKAIRRRPGKQMVEGKSFRLAEEVRYIQRRAADHHGRVVTVGQLVLFSTETGDAWLLDPSDQLAARLARDGDPEPVHIEENDTSLRHRLEGQLSHRGTRLHLFRSPDPARLNHPRIPHAPARLTVLKFQISLARFSRLHSLHGDGLQDGLVRLNRSSPMCGATRPPAERQSTPQGRATRQMRPSVSACRSAG